MLPAILLPLLPALPAVVDGGAPLYLLQNELDASTPTADSEFGECIAIDGDKLIVGSPIDGGDAQFAGVAYVYAETPTGWVEEARLLPSDTRSGDQFGRSVAIEGDFAFVGADNALATGGFVNGAVYVFERQGGTWPEVARIEPADGAFGDGFAGSLAVSNGSLIVGAPGASSSTGKAYVFVGGGATWTEQAQLLPAGAGQSGTVVDIDGDTALVTSPLNNGSRGAASVFTRTGTTWTEESSLFDSTPAAGERFGASGALCGDTAVVGSGAMDGSVGAAVVFTRSGTAWSEEQKLQQSPPVFGSAFGNAVALEGDTVVVGVPDDNALGSAQGAACVFERSGSIWDETQAILPVSSPDDGEQFGVAVALSGGRVAVGDVQGAGDSGEAAVFALRSLATVTDRNAGTNPESYVAAPAILGELWTATVDVSLTGDTSAIVFVSVTALELTLGGGQTLLADPSRSQVVMRLGPAAGPLASFSQLIPNDLSLEGVAVFTQALHLGGGSSFSLSNAQDLCVGF